jgi:hypothetical protein
MYVRIWLGVPRALCSIRISYSTSLVSFGTAVKCGTALHEQWYILADRLASGVVGARQP